IQDTVENTFCLKLSAREKLDYFDGLGVIYGGIKDGDTRPLLKEPTGIYLLVLSQVSKWLSDRLVHAQYALEQGEYHAFGTDVDGYPHPLDNDCFTTRNHSSGYMFASKRIPDPEACWNDGNSPWCDADDKVKLNSYTKGQTLTAADKKRIMHNIQDIGDFFGVAVDNLLESSSQHEHVPAYLLNKVFIPALDKQDTTYAAFRTSMDDGSNDDEEQGYTCSDCRAWEQVINTILMSGKFFMNF
ncbi:MAG: hypothetical protein OYH77_06195, partial [Pseudomonadota bacterium]|nr:hypothetical protein [Pseudomonadota bacterium]